jgi:hypothetical protein
MWKYVHVNEKNEIVCKNIFNLATNIVNNNDIFLFYFFVYQN